MKPEAYEEHPHRVDVVQTHISFVFLTENFAYKIKKAVNLGFLDFTTLEKRRFYCQKELLLNKRLCDGMYLDVVPIKKLKSIKVCGQGKVVEYAVRMKRIPQDRMLNNLLDRNQVDKRLIERIAKKISGFHTKAETSKTISDFGSPEVIQKNWNENFEQSIEFVGKTIQESDFEFIRQRIIDFQERNRSLFEKRIKQGKIKDCHGDIHSGNIFVADKIYIFDAIEFNERFRYSDVASDIAFLAMDLDFKKRPDLADFLTKKYLKCSSDAGLLDLLSFYKCYRAYIRGKVVSFKLKDKNIGWQEKESAVKTAEKYFKLAAEYAKTLF